MTFRTRGLRLACLALCAGFLAGCSTASYYAQLARGQWDLLDRRVPVANLLADPDTDAKLRKRLEVAKAARAFASDRLSLPRNGSYTDYADLGRDWVVQNVLATPEFSLDAVTYCFPVVGCLAYRGYYDVEMAKREVERLKALGDDVYLSRVRAYSTLGWFDDPLLNTMFARYDDEEIAGLIFHELGHQQLYVKGDTQFNESFATFIEEQGTREWRAAHGLPEATSDETRRDDQFTALVLAARERLKALYASGQPVEAMRTAKTAEIERFRADYRQLRDTQWGGYKGYDAWVNADINNAKLLPFGLYHGWVPAFAALFAQAQHQWPAFYAAAKKIAELDAKPRAAALDALLPAPSAT